MTECILLDVPSYEADTLSNICSRFDALFMLLIDELSTIPCPRQALMVEVYDGNVKVWCCYTGCHSC